MTSAREILTRALKPFGMIPGESGLRFVEDKADYSNQPSVYLALEIAERYEAQAVYLRFFEDAQRPPKPEVYVFYQDDFSADKEDHIKDQIRKVWNSGLVQQCYFFSPRYARLFSSWEMGLEKGAIKPKELEAIFEWATVSMELRERYHSRLLDSGLFWETPKGKIFKQGKTSYRRLLDAIKKVRRELPKRSKVPQAIANRLLVMTILLRYLEDRGKDTNEAALKADQFYPEFTKEGKGMQLADVFRNGHACLDLFERLASKNHLNGEVFTLDDDERKQIRKIDLEWLALFAEGKNTFTGQAKEYGQLSLWEWYSFDYLPIELISHIYEDFAISDSESKDDASGVVYTPPELVQFLLDEVMPLRADSPRNPKILDPACGSGIFLVGAYKRLIQLWRMDNQWRHPEEKDIADLQQLLSDCIFGCDKNGEAIRLTYFSLNLALLDSLSPKDIWDKKVHFQYLTGKNLFGEDFFQQADELGKFDIVVGNPPFLPRLTQAAQMIEKKLSLEKGYPELPYNQIALLFLSKSLEMLNPNGKCCLILPSGPMLYNNGSHPFRRHLIELFKFKTIFDFTALRTSLFAGSESKARPAVVAVLVDQSKEHSYPISHVIIRKNSMAEQNVAFETDGYDIHRVNLEDALNMDRIWQSNFMGGGRLAFLVKRIQSFSSILDFLKPKIQNSNWEMGEGWIEAPECKEINELRLLLDKKSNTSLSDFEEKTLEKRIKANLGTWITGKECIKTESFVALDTFEVEICEKQFFQWPRVGKRKRIFEPPHLLIKENSSGLSIPVTYQEKYQTFKHQILGIHSPWQDREELRALGEFIGSEVLIPLTWLWSGRVISNREGVPLMKDILALPYPNGPITFFEMEKVLLADIANYQIDFRKNGAKSHVLDPITDPNDQMLRDYAEWYRDVMNSVYKNFKETAPVVGNQFIGIAFYLGDQPNTSIPENSAEFEEKLKSILHYQHSNQLYVRRMLITYQENVVFIFKPNQKRYWTRSIAIIDADGTFADLVAQGY